jgi:peroxiredoxin
MNRAFWFGILCAALSFGQGLKPGSTVSDFTVTDLTGAPARFETLRGDVTVVLFVGTKCPISNDYNERMTAVYNDYSAKGVKFVFINSNENEPVAEVKQHARESGFPFAVYKDEGSSVANLFGAQVTPEAYVFDKAGVVRYHGYVDDSRNPARIRNHGLRTALDAVLSGSTPPAVETKAFGCTIKRARKAT